MKNYKEIKSWAGNTIEDAVATLLNYKHINELVCINFNDTILYSDTVNLDDAYIQITGKTKKQFELDYEKWCEEYDEREKKYKATVPALVNMWIKKGQEIIDISKWGLWEEMVKIRLNDIYHGFELENAYVIMKILYEGRSLEEAKQAISDSHSGWSYGLTCGIVKEFSNRGKEFIEYIS